eukprot:scaffold3014_cov111-Skeletonema_dohrnii-CCMP3373.AAC.6
MSHESRTLMLVTSTEASHHVTYDAVACIIVCSNAGRCVRYDMVLECVQEAIPNWTIPHQVTYDAAATLKLLIAIITALDTKFVPAAIPNWTITHQVTYDAVATLLHEVKKARIHIEAIVPVTSSETERQCDNVRTPIELIAGTGTGEEGLIRGKRAVRNVSWLSKVVDRPTADRYDDIFPNLWYPSRLLQSFLEFEGEITEEIFIDLISEFESEITERNSSIS